MSWVPTGWKLVPVEPTKEMVEAGCYDTSFHYLADSEEECINNYRTMLAAAPPPPAPVNIGADRASVRQKALREALLCCENAKISAEAHYGAAESVGADIAIRRIQRLLARPAEGGK